MIGRALLLTLLATACGPIAPAEPSFDAGKDAPACVREDPTCSSTPPSYAKTIQPLVTNACVTCHYPESDLARSPLTSYADLQLVYGSALGQVSACLMPPPSGPDAGQVPLTAAERTALLTWLACGAPDN
jgi:hypothetical protein